MMDRVKATSGLLVVLCALCGLVPTAKAERTAVAEERLVALLRSEAARNSVLLRQEEELQAAARALAVEALNGATGRGVARSVLWDHDVRDAEFDAVVLVGKGAPNDAAARPLLQSAVDWSRVDVGAVAVVTERRMTAVAFLLVRRVARFREPGIVSVPHDGRPRLVVTDPLGRVHERGLRPHPIRADAWHFDPATPDLSGRWLFELEVAQGGRASLAAIWLADGRVATASPKAAEAPPHNPLGLGPRGLGDGGEAAQASEALAWSIGSERPPSRAPEAADAAALEELLWTLLGARRRVDRQLAPRRWSALTATARDGARAAVDGEPPGRLVQRLMDREVAALNAEEHLLVAGSPLIAWALLLSEPRSRAGILGGHALGSVGAALRADGPGAWALGLSVVLAQGRLGPGGGWRDLVLAHLQVDRDAAGLPRLAPREVLDALALRTAEEVVAAGVLDLDQEARGALIAEVRGTARQILGVGVDVIVTTDPNVVAERAHTRDPNYSEVGLGVLQPAESFAGQPAGSLVLVLVFVQR